ncbi:hypothetical protein EUGRSUZ_K00637 [Eucalyptus grandis]|uniref:Uncharacterized protein n=2 Tax=Eucalyptus grandis TaxID=71139 RepID=A0ACC3IRC5_EUCGR|nr:hypothetical protein EUGRSUZ_K00637 [Eucalyptus grandis]
MARSSCFCMSINLLFLYLWSHPIGAHNLSRSVKPLCLENEISALLQFKERYDIANVSSGPLARPKTLSWNKGRDCCSWDGIECDENTGHVIILNLRSSFLYGSIDNNNTLFQLAHLEKLDLSDNHFNYSQIPSRIGDLLRLTYLNVSYSVFSGRVPSEIFKLTRLVYLDLCCNLDPYTSTRSLPASIGKLPSLSYLDISGCQFSGSLPSSIGHLPSLSHLIISGCNFSGSIPASFANLSNLEYLAVSTSPFTAQTISSLSWIWKIKKLASSYLEKINLYGEIPPSIRNLSQLVQLSFLGNQLSGTIPPSIGNLSQLVELIFLGNQLSGTIPSQLGNLTRLTRLCLRIYQLSGSIPSSLMSMTRLVMLDLAVNKFHGEIPSSISQLQNLRSLLLVKNNFSGTVELDNFLKLKQLLVLQLSFNKLSCRTSSTNVNLPQLCALGLASCNLSKFPAFLQNQESMNWLDLSDNSIRGEVPFWVWNGNFNRMQYLNLSHNFFTGLDQYYPMNPLYMYTIDLSHNMLQGPPPEAPPSIMFYLVSNNRLTGALPPWICNLSLAIALDLSSNDLTGVLPVCLGNISESLMILSLKGNNFRGNILSYCDNQLQGNLPRSLANCKMLEFINFANNLIVDSFPSWLGSLPELRVLILRSNKFHYVIERPQSNQTFLKLQILDLSINAFAVIYKGLKLYYPKISKALIVIDLSSNLFEGEILGAIGDLKGLRGLNLSNNLLTGHIPPSLGNLKALESLDLSLNKLSGQIPQKLTELGFLSFLNMSYNNLTGFVPKGKQFDTFSNDSFEGNLGLYSRDKSRQPSTHQEERLGSPIELDWEIVLLGYGSGLVIGVVNGNAFISWKHDWFEGNAKRMRQPRQPRRGFFFIQGSHH